MCAFVEWFAKLLASVSFVEIIKALAPVATTIIAFVALKNWQKQDKAKREAEFLETLVDAVHAYVVETSSPITLFTFSRTGMDCYAPVITSEGNTDSLVAGAILYINKNGPEDAKRLFAALEPTRGAVIKLKSLLAKGQIFGFTGYWKCHNAITMLTRHYDRLQAFAGFVSSTTWNWDNPDVAKQLKSLMEIDAEEMRANIGNTSVAVLEFCAETYKRIYGVKTRRLRALLRWPWFRRSRRPSTS